MAESDDDIIEEAKKNFQRAEDWEAACRAIGREDEKFGNADADNGWQWPLTLKNEREADNLPCLTINKTRQHCLQIINEMRDHQDSVQVRPVGGGATFDAAQVFEGMIRHIEYVSNAAQAYDTASWHQVFSGIGYWRIVTEFLEDSFDQEIYIRRVPNPRSVYLDPDIKEYDGSDARWGIVFEDVPRDVAISEGMIEKDDITTGALGSDGEWNTKEHVRVAEYFRRSEKPDELFELPPDLAQQLGKTSARGSELDAEAKRIMRDMVKAKQIRSRKIVTPEIEWFKIVGNEVRDRKPWAGRYIPIVRDVGEETVIDGVLDRKGHVRALKDPQRMYNYNSPLALDTRLPTPGGWTTMGDVQPGDMLLDEKGQPCRVVGTSPVLTGRKCYEIVFDDGTSIVADEGHRWQVEHRGKRTEKTWDWQDKVVITADLVPSKDFIRLTQPLELDHADLPIDPYLLGLWLGDGSSSKAELCGSAVDLTEIRWLLIDRGHVIGDLRQYKDGAACYVSVPGLIPQLKGCGVFENKHIPAAYLRGSRQQREALLQGLMDTDGHFAHAVNQCVFMNVNLEIIAGLLELLRSLGIKPTTEIVAAKSRLFPSGREYACQAAVRVVFTTDPKQPTFMMSRKRSLHERERVVHWRRTKRFGIRSIAEVESVPVRCVHIDTDTHLFLAGEAMVPTHNSASVQYGALQSKTPWLAPIESIGPHMNYWSAANIATAAVLPYAQYDANGKENKEPRRIEPPVAAPVFIEGMKIAQNELMLASGQYQAVMGQQSNETSGKAINARQRQGDNATGHYLQHRATAIRFTGKQLIDLIPKIYDTARVVQIIARDGTRTSVKVDPSSPVAHQDLQPDGNDEDADNEAIQAIFNPAVGQYDVMADVGPSYATERQEAFNAFSQIIAQDPAAFNLLGDLWLDAADFPGAEKGKERLRAMLPPQATGGPTKEMQAMQQHMQAAGQAGQQQIEQLHQALQEAQAKLAARDDELALDKYKAATERLKVIVTADPEGAKPVLRSALSDAMGSSILEHMAVHQAAEQAMLPPEPLANGQDTGVMNGQ